MDLHATKWIYYTQTKMSGPDSLELALIMKKKERKIDKWPIFLTSGSDMYNCFDE